MERRGATTTSTSYSLDVAVAGSVHRLGIFICSAPTFEVNEIARELG